MDTIYKYSNPKVVYENAKYYIGKDVSIKLSDKPTKKYMILNPNTNKWVYFGSMLYQDFLRHGDETRKKNYLLRSGNIKGNWKENPYSPNNLSRNILWQ